MINIVPQESVDTYQCPGCTQGPDANTCPMANITARGCVNHVPGTIILGAGVIALGLPKGFNRFGQAHTKAVDVYTSFDAMLEIYPNYGTQYSLPIWAHLDANGNTIVRFYSPRTNAGWSCVILGDHLHRMPDAIRITQADINKMD